MTNPLDPGYLFSSPDPLAFGTFAIAYLAVSVVGLLIGQYVYHLGKHRLRARPVLLRAASLYSLVASIVFGLAVFFFITRFLPIPILSWHFWLWLTAVAAVVLALGGLYHYLTVVPKQKAAYAESQRLRRYQPGAGRPARGHGSAPTTSNLAAERRRKRKKR